MCDGVCDGPRYLWDGTRGGSSDQSGVGLEDRSVWGSAEWSAERGVVQCGEWGAAGPEGHAVAKLIMMQKN